MPAGTECHACEGAAAAARAAARDDAASVHTYFSPYDSPYQAFINYSNCVQDLARKAHAKARR